MTGALVGPGPLPTLSNFYSTSVPLQELQLTDGRVSYVPQAPPVVCVMGPSPPMYLPYYDPGLLPASYPWDDSEAMHLSASSRGQGL